MDMKNQSIEEITKTYFSNATLKHIEIEKGDTLFDRKNSVDYIYFLKGGELSIIKNNQMVWQAFHHEFIGITSFFNREPNYSCMVKAYKKSSLIQIKIADFKQSLENHPALNTTIMKLFNDRINLIYADTKTHATLTRKKRLLKLIIDKVERSQNNRYIFRYTSKEISEFIGAPHHFVKKILAHLQEKKLIRFSQGKIEIIDLKGIRLVSE
jgi:CRP-like cAMP-binding protein